LSTAAGGTGTTVEMEKRHQKQGKHTGFLSLKVTRNGTKKIDVVYKNRGGEF